MIEFGISQFVALAIMGLGMPELLIVAAVFLLLFGGAKLPSLMRNMGRSVNEFKTGLSEKPKDDKPKDDTIEDHSKDDDESSS